MCAASQSTLPAPPLCVQLASQCCLHRLSVLQLASRHVLPAAGADDSWLEDRLFNRLAIEAVPASHPLAPLLRTELAALEPRLPAAPPRPLAPGAQPPTLTCHGAGNASALLRFTATGSIAAGLIVPLPL